jgi:GntR family transcriptional regulator
VTTDPEPRGPTVLDPTNALPRWAQLAADLRRRLAAGEFADRVPTEGDLAKQYTVSRSTVRQALGDLRAAGLLESRQGSGTFVAESDSETWGLSSLALTLRALGISESSEVRSLELRPGSEAPPELGLRTRARALYLERLRLGDGEPLALDRSWLPATLTRSLLDADLATGSLYAALARHCGVRVTSGREHLRPATPSAAERELLRLPRAEAVFVLERVALAGEIPVEVRSSVLRGDRYELFASWGDTRRT